MYLNASTGGKWSVSIKIYSNVHGYFALLLLLDDHKSTNRWIINSEIKITEGEESFQYYYTINDQFKVKLTFLN